MMDKKIDKFPSTFTIDNFSSTTTLTPNEIKLPIGNSKDNQNEKIYNPYEHRNLEHPNTFSGALIHILKSSLGTGILAIPMAFKNAGLLVGFIGTLFIGLLCTHTIHILVLASQKMCALSKVPSLGFAETASAVFKYGPKPLRPWSNFARLFVDIALVFTYFFGNAVYIVFIRDSIMPILNKYVPEYNIQDTYVVIVVTIGLLIFCQIRPLKFLVPFSAIANLTMLLAFGITFYYMIETVSDDEHVTDSKLAKGIGGMPKFLVTVIFAMEGIGTIMPVENSMAKNRFLGCPGVLNIAMSIVVFLYASIGFFGYYVFGEKTEATITNNLPQDDHLAMAGRASISAAVFFTFMLQFYVPMEISWRNMQEYISPKYYNLAQIISRAFAVLFIVAIALLVPDLETIIDLVGAVFFSTLGLFIPSVLDILVRWEEHNGLGVFYWRFYKNLFVIFVALFALVSGSYFALSSII